MIDNLKYRIPSDPEDPDSPELTLNVMASTDDNGISLFAWADKPDGDDIVSSYTPNK